MITDNDRRLGDRIQKLRKQAGLKQEDLAEKVRLSTKYIQFIETAHRIPSLKAIYRIANALGIKVSELFPF
jgi:transcriptional regulator with XRE-family HTH domain